MSTVLRRLTADGVIRSVCLLWLAGVAMRMTLLVMPPVIPQVHDEMHLSETQVGLLIGLPLAVFALAAIPGSLLIARIGATVAVTLGMAITAVAGGARAAAIDVWTLYGAALVSAFGIAIMQPGMPTLARQWLPHRIATGTIGYSAGMLMGAMLPAVLTIGYVLPAVGGSWRLDVLVWTVPALLMVPVFYFLSPRIHDRRDKRGAGGARWWPDWKNPPI
jgi:CP family cyanate transporter-like MFS transporter